MPDHTLVLDAAAFAAAAHDDQRRKTGGLYIAHLFDVAGLLIADDAPPEVVAAGLLHDTVEDTPVTLTELADRFGPDVAAIVDHCSEHREHPPVPWRVRKEAHLAALRACDDPRVLQVTAADKLSNVNSVLAHLAAHGADATWSLFAGGRDDSVWYYEEMSALVADRLAGSSLPPRLARAVTSLTKPSAHRGPGPVPPEPRAPTGARGKEDA